MGDGENEVGARGWGSVIERGGLTISLEDSGDLVAVLLQINGNSRRTIAPSPLKRGGNTDGGSGWSLGKADG